ncbi:BRCT domain-containing protein [Kineococcus rhizosphaerae]|uniref:BRCA1 C Terminus (BRCT) protein n=1 Tax=Kineococcus rhizosphaerae TaxID=559628 RepID=A0A2T0QTJ2_9ACTN|nr:BRCT domain-containing protein [Kineococcus rhizosphaerae]PRY08305.1 BRCA1 C Terminus (BRCT) protein [Kineococcus rhizosphaerae]
MTLRAGQLVAFSGHFLAPRPDLVARAERAGLRVEPTVTERTDVLVANDAGSGSAAVRAALALGVPIVDEYAFEDALRPAPVG